MSPEERKPLHGYFEGMLQHSPVDTWDEGLGTVYERIVMERWFRHLTEELSIPRALEVPCDGA